MVVVTVFGTIKSMGVLGAEVSSKGGATSRTAECSRKEERSRDGAQTFFRPAMSLPARRVCNLFGMLLTRWNTCCDPDEDQNLTTTYAPSTSSASASLKEKEESKLI